MRRVLALAVLLVATPAAAQKITIDYAHEVDFSKFKTFQYTETEKTKAEDPLMAERIVKLLKEELTGMGLKETDDNPDLKVTYHLATKDDKVLMTTGFGYGGFGMGWGAWGGGIGTATTTEATFTEGTLIVDAYETSDNKMVWRGTGTVTVKSDPEKQVKQIQRIFEKMAAKWEQIHKNAGE
ncbi:MAG: DUF4136 domain-containing protein [Acidobacteriota bacterium]